MTQALSQIVCSECQSDGLDVQDMKLGDVTSPCPSCEARFQLRALHETDSRVSYVLVPLTGEIVTKAEHCQAWMLSELENGPRSAPELEAKGLSMFGESTIKKVKQQLLVRSFQDKGRWFWVLPPAFETPHPISVDSGFVYFLLQENLARVKIGFTSKAPTERIKQLQTANPDKLIPIFVIENNPPWTEGELHERFNEYRVSGEWFEVKGKLRDFLFKCLRRRNSKYAPLVYRMNPPQGSGRE
jgi:Meiotically up-regulated gene 113